VGADGDGILVVTGTLTNVGDFDFRGLIIVTGAGGSECNGGGNGVIRRNLSRRTIRTIRREASCRRDDR
jgi:hypothetical protein